MKPHVLCSATMLSGEAEIEEQRRYVMAFTWLKLMLRALGLKKRRVNYASVGQWMHMVKQRGEMP